MNAGAFERAQGSFNEGMINADCSYIDLERFNPKLPHQFCLKRLPCFSAEATHSLLSVIAGERGEVHAGDGAEQPRRLPFFFNAATTNMRLCAAFHRAGVDANVFYPIKIQGDPAVAAQRHAVQIAQTHAVWAGEARGGSECLIVLSAHKIRAPPLYGRLDEEYVLKAAGIPRLNHA